MLGISKQTIHKYLNGQRPRESCAYLIEEYTKGQVNADELLETKCPANDIVKAFHDTFHTP